MSRVTALDVARLAGVSRSAVSRVFTPGASVSQATAAKVREAAETLGYRPNVLARSMLTGRSHIIGLVVAYLDNHFYPGVLERLSVSLEQEGYHLLVFMAQPSSTDMDGVVQEILDYQVDGLILASVALSSDLADRCKAIGVPVVLLNRRQKHDGETAIVSDNVEGGRLAARHLIETGARRIAHIAGDESTSTQVDREAGFLQELSGNGMTPFGRAVGGFQPERAKAAARHLFDRPDRPDAVFVSNDYMAFMVMDVLRSELGLRVPQDVAVVGFDDVPAASWPSYALTTIRQDGPAMVAATVAALKGAMAGTPAACPPVLPVSLVVRGSTRSGGVGPA